MKIIEIIDYYKKYRNNNVFNNINISFEKGKSYLLIGSNGSGKSTIIKSILGLVKYKGTIIKRVDKFGYVPEKTIIPLNLTVYEFLSEVSLLKGLEGDINKVIDEELLRWNIYSKKHKLIKTLSKGMMQKVAIIQSLLIDNDVYFFDEVWN